MRCADAAHATGRQSRIAYVVTCEHGGNRVPAVYASLFRGHRRLLDSHRGYDPGALGVARALAAALRGVLIASTISRLLVELNRSPGRQFDGSPVMRGASAAVREAICRRYYVAYRSAVEERVADAIARGAFVVHISAHSFTPSLDGDMRRADVGLLYDPARAGERHLCLRWQRALESRAPGWIVRRNYPYLGRSDGLASHLRKRHADASYAGIELEVNQQRVRNGAIPARDRSAIAGALLDALAAWSGVSPSGAR